MEGVLRRELVVQEAHTVRIAHVTMWGLPSFQGSITDGDGEWLSGSSERGEL